MKEGIEFFIFIALLFVTVPLLGRYMAIIFQDGPQHSYPLLGILENSIYRMCRIDPQQEMSWKEYAKAVLVFNLLGLLFLILIQLFQGYLPLNPQHFPGVEPLLAFNTAASFVTNTNWQAYGGENSLSYLTQMMGLAVQNFVSAAIGNAVLLALIRGIRRHSVNTIGNFWRDLTRTVVYLFLPLCCLFSLFLISQGVIQNFNPYVQATTIEQNQQLIPMGPVASQEAIKLIGTNGGGFFNANSAHPFENPTPLSNFFEMFALFAIPAAAVYMYGCMINSRKEGAIVFLVMFSLWIGGVAVSAYSESLNNPIMSVQPILEGKESRFGSFNSILWAVTTTGTSNGSVNAMVDSFSPLSGGIAMFNLMLGEIIFGGVGVGLCSMLMFVLLTVFLSGLMVGRTPEYLSKKIEKVEIQWVMLAILAPCALTLLGSGIVAALPSTVQNLGNGGPHGLSEILYAFSSVSGNNGSAFSGLNANTDFYNFTLGIVMLFTRMSILIPSLAIAGTLAIKKKVSPSLGSFSTCTPLFGVLLLFVILIVGALTFFPALSLGPIVEHFLMLKGKAF